MQVYTLYSVYIITSGTCKFVHCIYYHFKYVQICTLYI